MSTNEQPNGLRNIVVQERGNLPKRKLPKALLAFFAVCQLAFGFNFGFAKLTNKKIKTTFTILSLAVACFSITGFLFVICLLKGIALYFMTVYFIKYSLTVLILFCSKYSFSDFLADLISTYKRPRDEIKADKWKILWLSVTYKVFITVVSFTVYYIYFMNHKFSITLLQGTLIRLPIFGVDIMSIANSLLFYNVYARLRELKKDLEKNNINLEQLKMSYKAIADIFERFRNSYDPIFVSGFAIDALQWIIIILFHLILMKSSKGWLSCGLSYFSTFQITVEICVPAVFAEMINVQTDALKMILEERLLDETDETQALKTVRIVEYMTARPLLRRAWRLVPLDLQLPLTMLSMCATYLIVIVQFTHMYD